LYALLPEVAIVLELETTQTLWIETSVVYAFNVFAAFRNTDSNCE